MMNHRGNITLSIDDKKTKSDSCETEIIKSPDKIPISEPALDIQPKDNQQANSTRTKCHKCDKKLKLTAIRCKCNQYFCNAHRYSDCHDCKFDYKKIGKEILKKNNPIIVHTKVDKI